MGPAVAQVDRLVAVAVPMRRVRGGGALQRVQLARKLDVILAQLIPPDVPAVERPRQRAVDPAPAGAGPQQARLEPWRCTVRGGQRELDGERVARGAGRRGLLEQCPDRPLPVRPRRLGRRPLEPALRRGEYDRGHVLAVDADGTGAVAVLEDEPAGPGAEARRGLVQPALPDHGAEERVVLGIPPEAEHASATCVLEAPVVGAGADDRCELPQLHRSTVPTCQVVGSSRPARSGARPRRLRAGSGRRAP